MYGVIAFEGTDFSLFENACSVATNSGAHVKVIVSTGNCRIAIMGEAEALAHDSQAAWFGSAAQESFHSSQGVAALLDGAPDEVVAVGVHNDHLVLAAGRGNHRLFTYTAPGGVVVSTSLSILARSSHVALDRSYEDFLLGFAFLPLPRTPYMGIQAVQPGTRVSGTVVQNIAAPAIEAAPSVSFTEAIPQLRDRFFGALEEMVGSEKKHAVLLGGFDSMLVAASLRKMGHEVHTYTYSFNDPEFDQRNVDFFVSEFGIHHHPVTITPQIIAENLKSFSTYFFQPGALAHYQIHTLVASQQIAKDGHSKIFTGDGCDALFLSFPTVNRRAAVNKRLEALPDWLIRAAMTPLKTKASERYLGHMGRTMRSMLDNMLLEEPARGHLPNRYLDDYALSLLRADGAPPQAESVRAIRDRLAEPVNGQIGSRRAFHGNGLTAQSKVKVDGCVAATGLPHISPYIRPAFRSFVSGLPIDFLKKQDDSPATNGKEILVAMVREFGLLPEVIINQAKQSPSDSPLNKWFQHDIRVDVLQQLEDLPFEWNKKYVDTILRDKVAENWYRDKVTINKQTMQAICILATYASFNRLVHE